MRGGRSAAAAIAGLALLVACSRNPVLGDWEIDRGQSSLGAVLAAEAADLAALSLRSEGPLLRTGVRF